MEKVSPQKSSIFRQIAPTELKKGEVRKLQIIEAAIKTLASRGWLHTNYETVGAQCQMKRPHVAYHYPKWDDLIEAVIKYVFTVGKSVVTDYLQEHQAPKDQLKAYIEGTFHWLHTHPDHGAVITLLWHLGSFDKSYRKLSTDFKLLGTERVHAMLYPNLKINRKSEAWRRALLIHGLLVGRCVECVSTDLKFSTAQLTEQTFSEAWQIYLRAPKA